MRLDMSRYPREGDVWEYRSKRYRLLKWLSDIGYCWWSVEDLETEARVVAVVASSDSQWTLVSEDPSRWPKSLTPQEARP